MNNDNDNDNCSHLHLDRLWLSKWRYSLCDSLLAPTLLLSLNI